MRGRMGEEFEDSNTCRLEDIHCVENANIHAFLVSFFTAGTKPTDSVRLRKKPDRRYVCILAHFAQCSSVDIIQVEASKDMS